MEAVAQAKSNRIHYPNSYMHGMVECYCYQYESHEGKCLGPWCYCH